MPPAPRRPSRTVLAVLAAALLVLLARAVAVQDFSIPTGSMSPTVAAGDRVLVDTLTWRLGGVGRGDVVVFDGAGSFDAPGVHTDYLKRVAATGGDVVACCDPAGAVTVNGRAVAEPYVTHPDHAPFGPVQVPAGQLFLLGDNRADSDDSRYRGTVPAAAVLGRALAVTWPPSRVHPLR